MTRDSQANVMLPPLPPSPSRVRIQMAHKCVCHLCVLMAHNHEQVVQMVLSVALSVPAA